MCSIFSFTFAVKLQFYRHLKVQDNHYVTLLYNLRLDSHHGEIIDQADKQNPFRFLFDQQDITNFFAQELEGMTAGVSFAFVLSPEDAFGTHSEEAVVQVPRSNFEFQSKTQEADLFQVGNFIPMKNENGDEVEGRILDVCDNQITMDFNHPLAGRQLFIEGEILDIEDNQ